MEELLESLMKSTDEVNCKTHPNYQVSYHYHHVFMTHIWLPTFELHCVYLNICLCHI